MGIDTTCFDAILNAQQYCVKKDNMLTLGRQGIHIPHYTVQRLADKYNIKFTNNFYTECCETMFNELGYSNVDSIDYSNYEQAKFIHDMNKPIKDIQLDT